MAEAASWDPTLRLHCLPHSEALSLQGSVLCGVLRGGVVCGRVDPSFMLQGAGPAGVCSLQGYAFIGGLGLELLPFLLLRKVAVSGTCGLPPHSAMAHCHDLKS